MLFLARGLGIAGIKQHIYLNFSVDGGQTTYKISIKPLWFTFFYSFYFGFLGAVLIGRCADGICASVACAACCANGCASSVSGGKGAQEMLQGAGHVFHGVVSLAFALPFIVSCSFAPYSYKNNSYRNLFIQWENPGQGA